MDHRVTASKASDPSSNSPAPDDAGASTGNPAPIADDSSRDSAPDSDSGHDPYRFGVIPLDEDFLSELRRQGLPRTPTAEFDTHPPPARAGKSVPPPDGPRVIVRSQSASQPTPPPTASAAASAGRSAAASAGRSAAASAGRSAKPTQPATRRNQSPSKQVPSNKEQQEMALAVGAIGPTTQLRLQERADANARQAFLESIGASSTPSTKRWWVAGALLLVGATALTFALRGGESEASSSDVVSSVSEAAPDSPTETPTDDTARTTAELPPPAMAEDSATSEVAREPDEPAPTDSLDPREVDAALEAIAKAEESHPAKTSTPAEASAQSSGAATPRTANSKKAKAPPAKASAAGEASQSAMKRWFGAE